MLSLNDKVIVFLEIPSGFVHDFITCSVRTSENTAMKPKEESFSGPPSQNGHRRDSSLLDGYTTSQIRVITLRRRGNMPLGFSIRGGWEHGTGIFVSEVQPGSIAQRQGLRVGDQIVRINGFSIHRAIHMEVLSLLKTCPGVVLKVKRVGILPVKEKRKDPITWKVVEASHSLSQSNLSAIHQRTSALIPENCIIVKIEFSVPLSTSLGCSIAKGPPEMPGIFMCTVKEGGVASQAGLEVGDQIMDMNGTSFIDIKLPEAVALMKSAKDIRLTVKKGAGICLFADNSMDDHSVANGHDNNHSQYTPDSKACSTLSSRQNDGLKEHDFSGSSSAKSEASSFQSSVSSDSEKDYSISEESGIDGMKPQQNGTTSGISGWHKKTASRGSNDSGSSSSGHGATLRDDSWIAEERRKLEEEQRRLAEEKERLEAEKKKLQLEKKFQGGPKQEEVAPKGSFLYELQKAAAKMSIQDEKMDIDQLMLEKRCTNSKSQTLKYGENGKNKCQEDIIKRRQHEMLMEEFREAHKKMFGQQQNGVSSETAQNGTLTKESNGKPHLIVSTSGFLTTAKYGVTRSKAPAPPVPSDTKDNDSNKQKMHITVNGQVPSLFSQTLPRPERISPSKAKTSVDDMDAVNNKSPSSPVSFKVTFDTKNPGNSSTEFGVTSTKQVPSASPSAEKSGSSHCPLVEVNPWTTRL